MIIQTPRLCNDVAFLPPQKDSPNTISCSPILSQDEVPAYTSSVASSSKQALASQFPNPFEDQSDMLLTVGNIVIGGHKWIQQGKEIEKSAIVGGGVKETYVDTVADSLGKLLTTEQLQKLGISDPKHVEALKKRLKELAGNKEWKLDIVETPTGKEFRGIIDPGDQEAGGKSGKGTEKKGEGKKKKKQEESVASDEPEDGEEGSEETYKEKDEL